MKVIFELKFNDAMRLFDELNKLTYADTLHERFEFSDNIRGLIFKSDVKIEGDAK